MKTMRYNKFRTFACMMLLGVFCGCDFLDETPTTSLYDPATVYATEGALEAAIVGCYGTMQSGAGWQGEMMEYLQYASGLVRWKNNRNTENWTQTITLSMFPRNVINEKYYNYFYASIYACNRLIENLPESPVDQTFKDEIEGEARLIRAINYFALVRLYGDVPLVTETAKNIEQTPSPRESYLKVYEQILEDLDFAQTHMRSPQKQQMLTGTTGRPHKWAATSMMVAVYAQIACLVENKEYQFFDYEKNPDRAPDFSFIIKKDGTPAADESDIWELCLQTAEEVKNSNAYSLAYSYADLFRWDEPSDYQLNERVFVLQSTDNGATGVYTAVRTLPAFPYGTSQIVDNNNSGRIRPGRYVLQKWASVHGGELGVDREDGCSVYEICPDPRYDITYFHTTYRRTTGAYSDLYPADGKVKNCSSDPYFKKYLNPRYNLSCSFADFYLMRYAEVLLYAAEAAASLMDKDISYKQKALDYMEEIHARARRSIEGGSQYPSMADWGSLNTKEQLVGAIMWERVFELHGEGHEFFDTHRRGAKFMSEWLTKPINEFLREPEQTGGVDVSAGGTPSSTSELGRLFYNHFLPENVQQLRGSLLLAFPEVEFRNNSEIGFDEQNDFYFDYLPEAFLPE